MIIKNDIASKTPLFDIFMKEVGVDFPSKKKIKQYRKKHPEYKKYISESIDFIEEYKTSCPDYKEYLKK